ncbi:tetratricopeptide repeat protein [Hydrogenophaga sp. RWCD_12]|uniref:tetratricopeptide repeat protein n=1 Tax=Hydrogenophaga sp. RWCD_12 TaxID=3391190 RepID=UPI0039855FBE
MSITRHLVALCLVLFIIPVHADVLQDGQEAIHRKDYPTAIRLLEPLARAGNAQAQLRMGLLHYHGHGVRENDAQALAWFEQAARQGLAEAQFHLGNMYAYGLADPGPGADPSRLAAQWYFEAARQGHADAQYSLGILFLTGTGLVQNQTEATRWIERAAKQGHADASAYLQGKR